MSKFKIGDKVRVLPGSHSYYGVDISGLEGEIIESHVMDTVIIQDSDYAIFTIKERNLELLSDLENIDVGDKIQVDRDGITIIGVVSEITSGYFKSGDFTLGWCSDTRNSSKYTILEKYQKPSVGDEVTYTEVMKLSPGSFWKIIHTDDIYMSLTNGRYVDTSGVLYNFGAPFGQAIKDYKVVFIK